MNTFVGFFFVSLVTVLVYCNEAEASDSKVFILSLKPEEEDGQCSLTPDQFKTCSAVFLNHLNLQIPITADQFWQNLFAFIGQEGVGQGVSDLCSYVGQFKACAPTPCWTEENFNQMGVGAADYLFADGFIGFDNFCTGPGLDLLKNNTQCILPGMISHFGDLHNCVQGIDFNNIQCIKCSDLATAITCAINIIATECPPSLVLDGCQSLVVAGDLILPQCKTPLDGACVVSTALPPSPTTLPPPPATTAGNQPTTRNQPTTTPSSNGNAYTPPIAFLLIVIARTVVTIF